MRNTSHTNCIGVLLLLGLTLAACAPQAPVEPSAQATSTSPSEATGTSEAPGTSEPTGTVEATGTSEPTATTEVTATSEATATPPPSLADGTLILEQIQGLTEPTSLAVLGPDDLLVTEKSTGRVMRVQAGQVGEPVLDLATNYFDERGALGIALHPQFSDNGYVYIYWTWTGQGEEPDGLLGEDSEVPEEVPELGNRVDRFVWDGSQLTFDQNIVQLRSNTLNTDTMGRVRANHDGGVITFGPDGKLYVIIGDQNLRGQLQNLPDGDAVAPETLTGVILRLNDDGSVPDDNPFAGESGETAKIFVYGIRNSFGMTFDPQSGELWESENGDDASDEINRFEASDNSGWIQLMGPPERFDEWKGEELESEDGLDNPDFPPDQLAESAESAQEGMFQLSGSTYRPPLFTWVYPVAVTALGFIPGDALGADYAGDLLAGDVLTGSLYRFDLSEDRLSLDLQDPLADSVADNSEKGDLTESEALIFASGMGIVTDIEAGPDGSLWVASLSTGSLFHITK